MNSDSTGKTSPLRVAVLGFGARADGLVRRALDHPELFEFVAVADPNPRCLEHARELLGPEVKLFPDARAFYESGCAVDGVWVVSKEKTHADVAVPGIERGLPMILEKPLATTARDAMRIVQAHEKTPVPMAIPHTLRYQPHYIKVKEIVDSGVLGRILHVHATETIDDYHTVAYYRRGPGSHRKDTTILLAKSSHDIDIVNWMVQPAAARSVACYGGRDYFLPRADRPDRCTSACPELFTCPFGAQLKSWRETIDDPASLDAAALERVAQRPCAWNSSADQVDHQTLILQYQDGTTADFTLRCFGEQGREMHITGSDASVTLREGQVRLVVYHPHREELFDARADLPPRDASGHSDASLALLCEWADAVRTGDSTHSATVQESAEAVFVCEAADIAMMEQRVVTLDEVRARATA